MTDVSASPSNRRSVALLIETSNAYARGLLTGIVQYARELQIPWSIRLVEQGRGATPPAWVADWTGHGIIARIENQEIATAVQKLRIPVIDVSAAQLVPGVPWVETDDAAIVTLALAHLRERGFSQFAFCGDPRFNWSRWRAAAFAKQIQSAGLQGDVLDDDDALNREALADWLCALPKPIGIMACYDIKAQKILEVCKELAISVPDDVAVIGVDNDELLCNLSSPPLTSVIPDSRRAGYEAAHLLDQLMDGHPIPSRPILVSPRGIEIRQSTDVLAIDDRDIANSVRYIREHACQGINVQHVLEVVPLSRRVFEKRFRDCLGHSAHQEITRVKISRAEQLLIETDLGLATIAHRTGFGHAEYLSAVFKRQTGITPGQYRRDHAMPRHNT